MSIEEQTQPHLATEPVEMGNKEYLETRLQSLEEKYSEEELVGLGSEMLRKEETNLEFDFMALKSRFPHDEYLLQDTPLQEVQMGDDYRGLSTLTMDQKQLIRDTKARLRRNIGREMRKAMEREKTQSPVSRFGAWLNEFVEGLTPLINLNM